MIVITPGEPAGIGPDLIVMAAQATRQVPWLVIADADMLRARATALNLPLTIDTNLHSPTTGIGEVTVLHVPLSRTVKPGSLDVHNVAGVLSALDRAISGCLTGEYAALVTGPMQKSIVNDAGYTFSGHTEYLANACQAEDVVMLLVADTLRVALATTHIPLQAVSGELTRELLLRRLHILDAELKAKYRIAAPRILVAGLNPHAGESGHLGSEEIEIIEPVCVQLKKEGLNITGPLPADTLFTPQYLQHADAVMAMFHDQGLPVLKYAGFGRAVNVTLGLPFVRTSVDHGTALDRAGTGDIDMGSMSAAISLAQELAPSGSFGTSNART